LIHNVDNFDAMNLADVNNEVMVVNDEDVMAANDKELFYVSNSWLNVGANSSTLR
jgi:hypothetical protein